MSFQIVIERDAGSIRHKVSSVSRNRRIGDDNNESAVEDCI